MSPSPPAELRHADIRLCFAEYVVPAQSRQLVPYYHYKVITQSGPVAGHINFRVGETRHVLRCAGHVGYGVLPEHRGNSYALKACLALRPFIKTIYPKVILTADPDNHASIAIIRKLGALFIEEAQVPKSDPSYHNGARKKLLFEWEI